MTRRSFPPLVPGSDCEGFAEAATLLVDRELGAAETAALEAHLAVCTACRARVRQAETLSGVLRAWDADVGGRVEAPDRLRTTVSALLAEEGRWRRREWIYARFVRLASAASILLVFSAAVLLGLAHNSSHNSAQDRALAASASMPERAAHPASTLPSALPGSGGEAVVAALPPIGTEPLGRSRLHDLAISAARPGSWPAEAAREVVFGMLAVLPRTVEQIHVEAVCEDRAVWWTDPLTGQARLITKGALAYLRARGSESPEGLVKSLAEGTGRTVPASGDPAVTGPVVTDTGRKAADYLALPRTPRALQAALGKPLVYLDATHIRVYALPTLGVPTRATPLPVVSDLAEAVASGTVTLGEGHGDNLVAVVRGTPRPVFIPAGELIEGGRVDRLVARSVWLPATTSEERIDLVCHPVGTEGAASDERRPMATGLVAIPAVRQLLAAGASSSDISSWLSENMPYLGTYEYSLVRRYPERLFTGMSHLEDELRRVRARGIVLVSDRGSFLGVEVTDLPLESAAPLLTRLALSYEAEAAIERLAVRLTRDARAAWRGHGHPALPELLALNEHEPTLLTIDSAESPLRSGRIEELPSRVSIEVAERPDDGAAILASALAKP